MLLYSDGGSELMAEVMQHGASVTEAEIRVGTVFGIRNTANDAQGVTEVTEVESARASLIRSRNGHRINWRLLAAARQEAAGQAKKAKERAGKGANIFEFMDALREYDVPEEKEAQRFAEEAGRTAELCGQCGRAFDEGAAVYFAPKVYVGMATLVGKPRFQSTAVCEGCAPKCLLERGHDRTGWHMFIDEPCDTCGRQVVSRTTHGMYRLRRHVFCCARCQWTHHNTVRNERGARDREKVCEVCGEEFTAKRVDAKTCAPACKQKAYRRRRARV